MIYETWCSVTQQTKFMIMLKTSVWYKNIFGNAWYSTDRSQAEYQLKILRKKGAV